MPRAAPILTLSLLTSSLLASALAWAQPVPDALAVEWQGRKLCERLHEDAQIRVLRCIIPPGAVHLRHSHPGDVSYVLSGGMARSESAAGMRTVEFRTGSFSVNPPVPWHEVTNAGDTTLGYLLVEKKYEPVREEAALR